MAGRVRARAHRVAAPHVPGHGPCSAHSAQAPGSSTCPVRRAVVRACHGRHACYGAGVPQTRAADPACAGTPRRAHHPAHLLLAGCCAPGVIGRGTAPTHTPRTRPTVGSSAPPRQPQPMTEPCKFASCAWVMRSCTYSLCLALERMNVTYTGYIRSLGRHTCITLGVQHPTCIY